MMWFWARGARTLQLETRYDNDTLEFVIVLRHTDGRLDVERFQDIREFGQRVVDWEKQLRSEQWKQSGMPLIDPSGFPNRRLPVEWAGRLLRSDRTAAIAKRRYLSGRQTFEITLSSTPFGEQSLWIVERVNVATNEGEELAIPGIDGVIEPSESEAFAHACEAIDKWLERIRVP